MLRQKGAEAGTDRPGAGVGAVVGAGAGPTPGPSRKKAARRGSTDETAGKDSTRKRRRRAFSCVSCQRLKCRCEYDPGSQGCHRCQTLRIACSLRDGNEEPAPMLSPPGPARNVSRPSVEERLKHHEEALEEIKSMIRTLKAEGQTPIRISQARADNQQERGASAEPAGHDASETDPEYLSKPVDRGSKSAPIVVLREISEQKTLGYRRLLGHGNLDLVQLQLLDEQVASELIELFIKHQGHTLLVRGFDELRHRRSGCGDNNDDARQVSAFLHSVCCLIGIVYRGDICGTLLHRRLYEQVRMTLGQALLSSPLDLEDLNAMFIMSNNANSPSSQGVEYIDSWLLTGYCAKQAMLSIDFTQIINRLKRGSSTGEDHRAMHLWSTICLHHFHWATTTGRPSVIPKGYVNQCNVLLSFYQATMQDGMLVAEIMLYSILHQKILEESYPSDGSECEEFRTWKQKSNHLLALPTSSTLRIGYHAACLILAVRALGNTGDAPGSTLLLSTENTPKTATDQTPIPIHEENHRIPKPNPNWTEPETNEDPHVTSKSGNNSSTSNLLRLNACKYARQVLETFLEMPSFLMDATPTCTCLCIGYCALVLAHYDASQSQIPDAVVLRLISRLDGWIQTSPGKAWSYKYCGLARQKVEARMSIATGYSNSDLAPADADRDAHDHDHGKGGSGDEQHQGVSTRRSAASHESRTNPQDPSDGRDHEYSMHDMLTSTDHAVDLNDGLPPSFDLGEQALFPSMEGFFGGGFLDFMR